MTEGMTRLNQQVVESGYWNLSDRIGSIDGSPLSIQPSLAERDRRRDDVRRAVEVEIVPRVIRGHRGEPVPASPAYAHDIADADVTHFVKLLLDHVDDAVVSVHLQAVESRGVTLADIYLRLFQPAARQIGDLWADDRCSFVDVTLAVGTMQKMLRAFETRFHEHGRPSAGDRQALLVPLPGDQHTFGLSMVTEFFRRAGWSVWNTPLASFDDLGEAVRTAWFALVGFSASTDSRLDELAAAIRLVRRTSFNQAVGIMVGGPIFVAHPDYVARVGADAMGQDANEALARAEDLVIAPAGA